MLVLCYCIQNVTYLTVDDFDKHTFKIVKFFQPWCGHCKHLAPIYKDISNMVTNIEFTEVDCSASSPICERFGINSYPKVRVFSGDEFVDYDGLMEKAALLLWARDITNDQFPRFYTEDEVKRDAGAKGYNQYFVYYSNSTTHPEFEIYNGYLKIYCIKSDKEMMVAHRDGIITRFKGQWTMENINAFFQQQKLPVLIEYDNSRYGMLTKKNVTYLVVNPDKHQLLLDELTSDLIRHGEAEHFNRCWMNGNDWHPFIETYHPLTKADYPLVMIINYANDKYYWAARIQEGQTAYEVLSKLESEIEGGLKPRLNKDGSEKVNEVPVEEVKKEEEIKKEEDVKKEEEKKVEGESEKKEEVVKDQL